MVHNTVQSAAITLEGSETLDIIATHLAVTVDEPVPSDLIRLCPPFLHVEQNFLALVLLPG